ncbi:MAG: hypothetical protein JWO19_524 [Bryobacterales bacterium]|nr:hypothetical protein [Bryobacterales bacterium]
MTQTKTQNFTNHAYTPRMTQVAGLPAIVALILLGVEMFRHPSMQNLALICLAFSVMVLVAISRAYTVRLQDRIIRLEMLLRLERLGHGSDFPRLSTRQLVALRFASDAELPDLVGQTLTKNFTADQIKRAVSDWQADLHRT